MIPIPINSTPNSSQELPPDFFAVDFGRKRHQTELESQKFIDARRQRASSFSVASDLDLLDSYRIWEPRNNQDNLLTTGLNSMPPNGLHASNLRSNSHSNEFPRPSEFYRNSSLLPPISSSSVSNGIGHSAGHSGGQSVSHSAATKHVLSNNHLGHNGIGHSTSSGLSSTSLGQNHGGLSHNHVPSLLDSKVDYVDRTLGYLGLGDQSHRHRSITIAEFPVSLEKPHFSRTISSMAVMENDAPLQGFEENVFGNTHSPVQSFDEKVLGFNVAHENVDPFAYSKQQESPPPSTNANSWEEMTERFQQAIATAPSSPATIDGSNAWAKDGKPRAWDKPKTLVEQHSRVSADNSRSEHKDQSRNCSDQQLTPSRSLWIGNVEQISSDELLSIFSKFGKIETIRMLPSRECGFVNFIELDDAIIAREKMNGAKLGNVVIKVGYGKIDVGSDQNQPTKSLWVGNILPSTKPSDLEQVFGRYGKVESARVLTHKNCGFVNFYSAHDAIIARDELNGRDLAGAIVKIGFAKVPKAEMMTKEQALANPGIIAGLAGAAMDKIMPWASADNAPDSPSMFFSNADNSPFVSIPLNIPTRKHDQARLREIRKKMETNLTSRDIENYFNELLPHADELASDYIGNVIVQKFMEKGTDSQRLALIEKLAPRLASLGIHKNGTWAVQKVIDLAKTPGQVSAIVECLRIYAPALMMDQFGNYVIQCCLRLGSYSNQFIFDAIATKIWDIGQNRFGARATKACLESEFTTKPQQKQVSLAIVQSCVQLSMNGNGSILVTWLLDSSMIPGRYRVLAPTMIPHLKTLCCHKLASQSLFKIITQRVEMDARDMLVEAIFEGEGILSHLICDYSVGCVLVTKILSTGCLSAEERIRLAALVRKVIPGSRKAESNNHKKLVEELSQIPMTLKDDKLKSSVHPPAPGFYLSPTRNIQTTSQAAEEPLPLKYSSSYVLPTPNQSPVHNQKQEKKFYHPGH